MKRLIVATVCAGLVLASVGEARAGPLARLLPRNWGRHCSAAGSARGGTQYAPAATALAPQPPYSIPAPAPP